MTNRKQEDMVTLTIDQAMTVIAALATALGKTKHEEQAPPPAPDKFLTNGPDVRALAQLPVIGGSDFDAQVSDAFNSDLCRARFLAGVTVSLYIASNEAFRTAGRTMKPPCFKIGLAAPDRLHQRQIELDRDGYGAIIMRHEEPLRDEAFGAWDLLRMPDLQLSPGSPVAVGARDLRVTLPAGMTFAQFDTRLTAALTPASLTAWTASEAGRRYCRTHGLDIDTLRRFTAYEFGTATRLSPATELIIFRPKTEVRRLALLVESIIADWMATAANPVTAFWPLSK